MDIFIQLDLEDLCHIFRWLRYAWKCVQALHRLVRWHRHGGRILLEKDGTNRRGHHKAGEVMNSSRGSANTY